MRRLASLAVAAILAGLFIAAGVASYRAAEHAHAAAEIERLERCAELGLCALSQGEWMDLQATLRGE